MFTLKQMTKMQEICSELLSAGVKSYTVCDYLENRLMIAIEEFPTEKYAHRTEFMVHPNGDCIVVHISLILHSHSGRYYEPTQSPPGKPIETPADLKVAIEHIKSCFKAYRYF